MPCAYCKDAKWIQKEVTLPRQIYGEVRKGTVAVPCKFCNQPKTPIFDGKAAAAK